MLDGYGNSLLTVTFVVSPQVPQAMAQMRPGKGFGIILLIPMPLLILLINLILN